MLEGMLRAVAVLSTFLLAAAIAQRPLDHVSDFDVPPPLKQPPKPKHARPYEPALPESDAPWTLPEKMFELFVKRSALYEENAHKFVCDETVELARYDRNGEASSGKQWRHAYYLSGDGFDLIETRLKLRKDGSVRLGSPARFQDDLRFPPSYAWLLLFNDVNRGVISVRYVEERVEGFGLVHEIHFRGGLPFQAGKDVREWEGTLLVDAATLSPLSIVAEPRGQNERLQEAYRRYVRSLKVSIFGMINFRSKPEARGYRAQIDFDRIHDGLRFPSRVRYDTFELVSGEEVLPVMASTRWYDGYRFTAVDIEEHLGTSRD